MQVFKAGISSRDVIGNIADSYAEQNCLEKLQLIEELLQRLLHKGRKSLRQSKPDMDSFLPPCPPSTTPTHAAASVLQL